MSALDTPEIVYGNTVPEATFPVVNVTTNVTPSSGVAELTPKKYVGSGKLVSAIVTLVVASPLSSANVNVSVPSSNVVSADACIVIELAPPTMKFPVKLAPPISVLLTPVIVYGTIVLATRFVVASVIVNVLPSFTLVSDVDNKYVGAGWLVSEIITLELAPPLSSAITNVSVPSVVTSEDTTNVITSVF